MKLTQKVLRQLVLDEAKKFGKPKNVEDCSAEEVEADELASSLEKKEDFTVKEVRDNARIADKALALAEQKLSARLREVRVRRARIAKALGRTSK